MKIEVIEEEIILELSVEGEPGRAATVSVESTETLPVGEEAYVENVGTPYDARLKFGIPSGKLPAWGEITGDLEDQTDLMAALAKKVPAIINTVTGSPVSVNDGMENGEVTSIGIDFSPEQSGSGDPKPDNKRPFVGKTGFNLLHTGAGPGKSEMISVSFGSAGTVYGGEIDLITGELTVIWAKHVVTEDDGTNLTKAGTNGYRVGIKIMDGYLPQTEAQRLEVYCNMGTPSADCNTSTAWHVGDCLAYPG